MLTVLKAGMMTSVQDGGRMGWQRFGVPVCGAMDPEALAIANILCGNDENHLQNIRCIYGRQPAFAHTCRQCFRPLALSAVRKSKRRTQQFSHIDYLPLFCRLRKAINQSMRNLPSA